MFQKWLFVAEVTFLKHILNPDEQNIYMLMNRKEYLKIQMPSTIFLTLD